MSGECESQFNGLCHQIFNMFLVRRIRYVCVFVFFYFILFYHFAFVKTICVLFNRKNGWEIHLYPQIVYTHQTHFHCVLFQIMDYLTKIIENSHCVSFIIDFDNMLLLVFSPIFFAKLFMWWNIKLSNAHVMEIFQQKPLDLLLLLCALKFPCGYVDTQVFEFMREQC